MFSAFLTLGSALLCGCTCYLLVLQGRNSLLSGKLAIAFAAAGALWFAIRSFRHPFIRAHKRSALWLGLSAAFGGYGLVVLALFLFQDTLLFVPTPGTFARCGNLEPSGFQAVDTRSGMERIRAYVRREQGARAWILMFHGNAESACDAFAYSEHLADLPLNFALVEYPGYQDDSSPRSQAHFIGNAQAVYEYFINDPHVPAFLFGRSLGTGIATYLASAHPSSTRGLILVSPYPSIEEVAGYQYPFLPIHWLLKNPFPASQWANEVSAPALIVHGTRDRTIPIALARELSRHLAHLTQFAEIPGAGHGDILYQDRGLAWTYIRGFLKDRLAPPSVRY